MEYPDYIALKCESKNTENFSFLREFVASRRTTKTLPSNWRKMTSDKNSNYTKEESAKNYTSVNKYKRFFFSFEHLKI